MSRSQRELPTAQIRKETFLNLRMLSNARPMQPELTQLLFEENSLDKPTQNLFNHLSYYLATIIDSQAASKLTWPLFDFKDKRVFRNELNAFVCSNKRLTPVISSYFVNPGCHKVTVLIFQMSSLAIRTVVAQVGNESQKITLKDIDKAKLKGCDKDSLLKFVKKTQMYHYKLSNHIIKIQMAENIASKLCNKIVEYEERLQEAQKYINSLVDNYIECNILDDITKHKILSIKNVMEDCPFFDDWLTYVDSQIIKMEEQFNKTTPFTDLCQKTSQLTKDVVMRFTSQRDRNEYMISYNPETDKICTQDLERQVNVEQAYILKNIDEHGKLNFPNLIRAFPISIQYILKNIKVDNQIYDFNKFLQISQLKYHEITNELQCVMERLSRAEGKLEYTPPILQYSNYGDGKIYRGYLSGPSLENLKACRNYQAFFETFSPLKTSKHKINFYRTINNFKQPLFINLQPPKDDFMKSLISYNINPHLNNNITSNSNLSVMSNIKSNETIAGCSSGFTKQQIQRLFSTKKTSTSKKLKSSNEKPANIKTTALNFDSGVSIDSCGLTRSYSSPNLSENREKRSILKDRRRKLSSMKEDSTLELSGISVLCNNSNIIEPGIANAKSTIKIIVTDFSEEPTSLAKKCIESTGTPETNTHLIKKTSSIEKIIKRFKKVRANVIPTKQSFIEQEENCFADEKVVRSILPDLISPSLSFTEENRNSNSKPQPRESLGDALGVDETFLDQFDLID